MCGTHDTFFAALTLSSRLLNVSACTTNLVRNDMCYVFSKGVPIQLYRAVIRASSTATCIVEQSEKTLKDEVPK